MRIKSLIPVWCTLCTLFFVQACQEFESNSFTTYIGVLQDEEGSPVEGVELFFGDRFPQEDSLVYELPFIYRQRTNRLGEFRFVVPSRNFDEFYVIWVEKPFLLEYEQFNQQFQLPFIYPQESGRDQQEGIVPVVPLTLITP